MVRPMDPTPSTESATLDAHDTVLDPDRTGPPAGLREQLAEQQRIARPPVEDGPPRGGDAQ